MVSISAVSALFLNIFR